MSKKNKEKRWCDNQHKPPKDTYFIIGKLAGELYTSAENYLIHDINKDMSVVYEDEAQNKIARNYVIKKLYNILDTAEKLENAVYSANAIYAWYDIDFAARRKGWIKAKGLCFELSTQLNHVGTKTLKGTNLQKYVDLSKDANVLSEKEVKEAIAEKYNVPLESVMKLKYSYIIIKKEGEKNVHN